jgi:hypothetical protein
MDDKGQTSPLLFEDKARTRFEPKAPGEDDYSFYDSAARPEYDIYRALLNGWMKEMSEPGQKELLPRFRKNESLEYQTALAELTTHAALKNQGYAVDVHPASDQTDRKPDFLARDAKGESAAYVEVTTFGPSKDFTGKHKRAAVIYNGADKAKLPVGCRLGLDILKHGTKTPSLRKLKDSIEKWAGNIGEINPDDPPSKTFEIEDWKIEIILFGGFTPDIESKHAIATAMGDVRILSAETEIRQALSTKGKRYGKLDAPYLIVIRRNWSEATATRRPSSTRCSVRSSPRPESWRTTRRKQKMSGWTTAIGGMRTPQPTSCCCPVMPWTAMAN